MSESHLNLPERLVQRLFMKARLFSGLTVGAAVLLLFVPMHRLAQRRIRPDALAPLVAAPVDLPQAGSPFEVAGAWRLTTRDWRSGGLSALAIDGNLFVGISDLGAAVVFDRPRPGPLAIHLTSLRDGPGDDGRKESRDAESLMADPRGRGWWVGFEQQHSLWLYDHAFRKASIVIDLRGRGWGANRGIEALIQDGDALLALAENGRDGVRVDRAGSRNLRIEAGTDIADAARAPDGSAWVLLRSKDLGGISQWIAPLVRTRTGFRTGARRVVPKLAFDNYEGMAIEAGPKGGLRFWLVTDDGHWFHARTLLVALDLPQPGPIANEERPTITPGASNGRPTD
jgi:hypothetical protein